MKPILANVLLDGADFPASTSFISILPRIIAGIPARNPKQKIEVMPKMSEAMAFMPLLPGLLVLLLPLLLEEGTDSVTRIAVVGMGSIKKCLA